VQDLSWSLVDLFHRKVERVERRLDDNDVKQRSAQSEQDGSEVRSLELERLTTRGHALMKARSAYEQLRDKASEHYEELTGSAWRPRSGTMANRRHLTAATIDSRDFINAKRLVKTQTVLPAGPKIGFAGGAGYNDVQSIYDELDRVRAKHPDMVLLHGGQGTGAERIAACWAAARKVVDVAFKPDWSLGKSAGFRRNDKLLDLLPIGVIVFPGTGVTDNFADKARSLGIPVIDRRR
jgi:hypothetical protein